MWLADIISGGLWERKREFWEWSDHRKVGMSEAKRQADREKDATIKVKEAQRQDDDTSKQRERETELIIKDRRKNVFNVGRQTCRGKTEISAKEMERIITLIHARLFMCTKEL